MAQEDRNRLEKLGEWLLVLRGQAPVARERLGQWLEDVRDQPQVIWQTPASRYSIYGVAAVLLAWGAFGLGNMIAPPPPPDAAQLSLRADFHVICTRAECGEHFVINRAFGFRRFPVDCPACRATSGERAVRCYSPTCRGRWIVPKPAETGALCPRCGGAVAVE